MDTSGLVIAAAAMVVLCWLLAPPRRSGPPPPRAGRRRRPPLAGGSGKGRRTGRGRALARTCAGARRRAVGVMDGPSLEIWDRCGKCAEWFECSSWYDPSVPTPCCPGCALAPSVISYVQSGVPPDGRRMVHSELWLG